MRPRRLTTLALLILLPALVLAACSDDDADDAGGDTGRDDRAAVDTTTTSTTDAAPVDQAAPRTANGITIDDEGQLWIAALGSDEILRVDRETGEILDRYATPASSGPDDLVIGDDGTVYWTGYTSGDVGALDPTTGETTVLGNVGEGANPIARRDDGMLVVGRAVIASGLFAVDPDGEAEPEALDDPGNVNSFSIGPDGLLYGPRTSLDGGAAVLIDPDTGDLLETIAPIEGIPVALRWHDEALYVLALAPEGVVFRVDLASRTVERFADTGFPVADNLAVADDGTVYVTGFDQPVIAVFGPDGEPQGTLDIGHAR